MKKLTLIIGFVLGISATFAVTVSSLLPPEFADMEVSTNIPICVNLERLNRMYFTI